MRLLISVLISALPLSGCVVITTPKAVPHASFKVGVSERATKQDTLSIIHRALLSAGYTLQENDWEVWKPILSDLELKDKKQERRYSKNQFEFFYRSDTLDYIRLSFYEHEVRQFTNAGISEYRNIKSSFHTHELVLLASTAEDARNGRSVVTPEQFNKNHPPPTAADKTKEWGFLAVAILSYLVIVFLPAWFLIKKFAKKAANGIKVQRLLFAVLSAALLFPMPLPLSMFGPMLLVPGIFLIPAAFGLPQEYFQYAAVSFCCALLLSAIASIKYVRKYP